MGWAGYLPPSPKGVERGKYGFEALPTGLRKGDGNGRDGAVVCPYMQNAGALEEGNVVSIRTCKQHVVSSQRIFHASTLNNVVNKEILRRHNCRVAAERSRWIKELPAVRIQL